MRQQQSPNISLIRITFSYDSRLNNVTVEVIEAEVLPANLYDRTRYGIFQKPPVGAQTFDETYKQVPSSGLSVGIRGGEGSGTLGMYIRVTFKDGGARYFFCTSHHVISSTFCPKWFLSMC